MSQKLSPTQELNDDYKKRAPVLPMVVDNTMTDLVMASVVTRKTMKVKPCAGIIRNFMEFLLKAVIMHNDILAVA